MRPRRVALLLLWATAGCTVPSLSELEKIRPRSCDPTHRCLDGYDCVGGVCRPKGSAECAAGATLACGSDKGECVAGARTCGQDGRWGNCLGEVAPVTEVCDGKDNDCDDQTDEDPQTAACGVEVGVCAGKRRACIAGSEEATCTVASYGGEYHGSAETACDGKDNDCDNQVDENLSQSCGVDAGVCGGARKSCVDGGFGACTAADFLANSAAYQPYESRCDGLDNDCNGQADVWTARVISDAGTAVRRRAAGIAIPDAGSGEQHDVLTFYEEGNRVVMRQLRADGTVGLPVLTTQSVGGVVRAYGPSLASDGTTMVAAWFDELSVGPSVSHRLFLSTPSPEGYSFINGSPGATPLTLSGPGVSASVAVSGGRIGLAFQWDDSGVQRVTLANCPLDFSAPCGYAVLSATGIKRPRVALSTNGVSQYVAYENVSNGRVSLVTAAFTSPGGVPTLTPSPPLLVGADNETDGWVFYDATALKVRVYYFDVSKTAIRMRSCDLPCTSIQAGSTVVSSTFQTAADAMFLTGAADEPLAIIEGNNLGVTVVAWEHLKQSGGSGTVIQAGRAQRASAVMTTFGPAPRSFTVLYATEASTGGGIQPDVVWARRFCGP